MIELRKTQPIDARVATISRAIARYFAIFKPLSDRVLAFYQAIPHVDERSICYFSLEAKSRPKFGKDDFRPVEMAANSDRGSALNGSGITIGMFRSIFDARYIRVVVIKIQ